MAVQQAEAASANQGNFSHEDPSDLIIIVDGVGYALHKFPMMAHSGFMRRIIKAGRRDSDQSTDIVELPDFPGGAETFDLVARFCYGINFHIATTNVAALRCAADYLQMKDDDTVGASSGQNLVARTEAYLRDHVLHNLNSCIQVLKACHVLQPFSQKLDIINRCIHAAADHVCNLEKNQHVQLDFDCSATWVEEVTRDLPIDEFHALLSAMKSRGVRSDTVSAAVVQYSETWLSDVLVQTSHPRSAARLQIRRPKSTAHVDPVKLGELKQQKRIVEKLISLIPKEKNVCSVSFLLAMLKVAIWLDASRTCRLDLERRIGLQLEQATVDDLLIPNPNSSDSYIISGAAARAIIMNSQNTIFDLDSISRIVVNFLDQRQYNFNSESETSEVEAEQDQDFFNYKSFNHNISTTTTGSGSPERTRVMKVIASLLDNFLAEVAPDVNLTVPRFIAFAELLPDYARTIDDGLYRAIDVYLKSHSGITDLERKKICSLIDCQKLSEEACSHAAQNERLPVQVIVQVLYFQQMRLSQSVDYANNYTMSPATIDKAQLYATSESYINEQYAAMQRENLELRIEMTKMKLKLQDMPDHDGDAQIKKSKPVNDYKSSTASSTAKKNSASLSYSVDKANMARKQAMAEQLDSVDDELSNENATITISSESDHPKPPKSRFFHSFSKKLGKLNPFSRSSSSAVNGLNLEGRNADVRSSRRPRRHSMS